jgi:hypothetical protein
MPTYIAAVTLTRDQRIKICIDADNDEPVEVPKTVDVSLISSSYQTAIAYMEGIMALLDYFLENNLQDHEITIHLDNLMTYNIVTRYLACWSRQWHTARGTVPARNFMQHFFEKQQKFSHLKLQNVSAYWVPYNQYLQRIKKTI